MEQYAEKYIGKRNFNNQGYEMEITGYTNYDHIQVTFLPPYSCTVNSKTNLFRKGEIRNPYAPTICGVGIVGNKYPSVNNTDGNHCREYQAWSNLLKRCYNEKARSKNKTYQDVECCSEWFYYENFYEWLHNQSNFKALQGDNWAIDKDILCKGNKLYSPDKCVLVPQNINNLLLKSDNIRGKCPIGVHYVVRNKKYVASCGGKNNHHYLGIYKTPEEAFEVYKYFKESEIKERATIEYQKGRITQQCYDALIKYRVEITD